MLSRPPTSKIIALETLMHMEPFTMMHTKMDTYMKDEEFKYML
jgi:hypothetical protein